MTRHALYVVTQTDSDMDYNAIKEYLQAVDENMLNPSVLYHYTTIETFEKLVSKDADLLCTHYMDLNDDVEFKKGYFYFRDHCGNEELKELLDKYWIVLRKLQRVHSDSTWIMSFSTERDSLSQWRAYTDRQRGGVAIGFCKTALEAAVSERNSKSHDGFSVALLPCLYYDSGDDKRLDGLMAFLFKNLPDGSSPTYDKELKAAIHLFASIVKDKSFEQEKEWRLIVQTEDTKDCEGARVIADKARIPVGFTNDSDFRIGEMMQEVILSPHGNSRRLMHGVWLSKNLSKKLKYKTPTSKLPFVGR